MSRVHVAITVNGKRHERAVEPRTRLADFLREELGLTGTHLSCEHGVCGVCTILMDGEPSLSCLTLAAQADGREIATVESLATGETLHPIQQAFWENHGLQCGFCTPGFLMVTHALLRDKPDASDEDIAEALDGVICRCTGYQNIRQSVLSARDKLRART